MGARNHEKSFIVLAVLKDEDGNYRGGPNFMEPSFSAIGSCQISHSSPLVMHASHSMRVAMRQAAMSGDVETARRLLAGCSEPGKLLVKFVRPAVARELPDRVLDMLSSYKRALALQIDSSSIYAYIGTMCGVRFIHPCRRTGTQSTMQQTRGARSSSSSWQPLGLI